jgi:hypothetical protein
MQPFDRSRLTILPLGQRVHDLDRSVVGDLQKRNPVPPRMAQFARYLRDARDNGRARTMMMGAHVIRSGVQRYLFDLMERGYVSALAVNGACLIHDFELALIGATTESVARYVSDGQFGLWEETGRINDIAAEAAKNDEGLGSTAGRVIAEGDFPHKDVSVFARAYELGIPVTVHVGIGYDIVCEHPNYDGAAWGKSSYADFLLFAGQLETLHGGTLMSFGSAVMAPEIFLKALAMARNTARAEGGTITDFSTLVCDLVDLPDDFSREAERGTTGYYFRPWKTLLVRTVADGGRSFYVRGTHAETIPALWTALSGT